MQTYFAYETQDGRPVAIIRKGSYEALRAWADAKERAFFKKHKFTRPIWVDAIIYPVG